MRTGLFFLFFVCTLSSFAQKAQQAIETLYKNYAQEKVVLTLSKNEYVAGETIYFKAYVLNGYEPSSVSTNLYTELYDENKKVIQQHIIPLLNGSGEGSFVLPPSLGENVYYIRAYTQYMLNYDEAFQYLKPVNIYNPVSMNKLRPKPMQWAAAAFAEGGTFLNDIPVTLAIRLYSTGNLPQSWQGSLHEKGSTAPLAEAEVFNTEIGIVRFTPKAGKEYVISIKDNGGKVQVIDVPKASNNGTALRLVPNDDKIGYSIQTKNLVSNGVGYKLVGTVQDQVVFLGTIKKSPGVIEGLIDIKDWPSGILQLTLFNEKDEPVNSRLCFIHQQIKTSAPELKTDTVSFSTKGFNNWSVSVDSTSWPAYSVQINDAAYPFENNFLSDVYLTADFSTPAQNASWYFQEVNEVKKAALDALLISEKWSRFNWNDLVNNRFPTLHFYPDQYLSYSATVHKGKKLQLLKDINLVLQTKDSLIQFIQVESDSTGRFKLTNLIFLDTIKVYYQANNRKVFDRDVQINFELQNKFHPYKRTFPSSAFEVAPRTNTDTLPAHIKWTVGQKSNELLLNEKEKVLEEVVVYAQARNLTRELERELGSGLFSSGGSETIFDFINEDQTSAQGYTNILEWLYGRVPGFSTRLQDDTVIPLLRGAPAQVFLDEMPVDNEVLSGLSASNIAMIKVIRGFSLGSRGGNGAIVIYTRKGNMNSKFSTPSLPNNILTGYQKQPDFFSPDYRMENLRSTPDQREILFRSTLLYPANATLTAPVKFYNNDRARQYRLLVTGFTNDGKLVYLDQLIQ
jgi:hypothetical protein